MSMYDTAQSPVTVVRGTHAAQLHATVIAAVPASIRCTYEFDSPQEIIHFDNEMAEAGIPLRRWLVGSTHHPEGIALCFRPTWKVPDYTFWVHVRMLPHAHADATLALWHEVVRWAKSAGARTLQTMAHPGDTSTLPCDRHAQHIGTEQIYRRAMPLGTIALPTRPAALSIHTLAERMQHDPDAIERACTLHAAISRDVPLPDEPIVTMTKFRRLVGEFIRPEHYVIAMIDNEYVAESILYVEANQLVAWQHATGVLPAYRGHGIAQHVKYASLEIAARLGVRDVCTWVESRNKSMLHINTQFGFAMLHDVHAISHIYEITLE